MEKFYNIQTFIDNNYEMKKIDKKILKLLRFTSNSKIYRDTGSKLNKNIDINNHEYVFNYNGKSYPFKVFSDYDLQAYDKKLLESDKRIENELIRTLKLACSMDLNNVRVAIGNSLLGALRVLIIFEDNKIDKVIDYSSNTVMNKEDYFEIFNYKTINIVDKFDLYNIYYILKELESPDYIFEFLLFNKELFKDLSKIDDFDFLAKKYSDDGINYHNMIFIGDNFDSLFFSNHDRNKKYENTLNEIDAFTKNPDLKNSKHVTYDEAKSQYRFENEVFEPFNFYLLSDLTGNQEIKDILFSNKRYHKCHENSINTAMSLAEDNTEGIYVVGGKFKENENDYYYHSWIEINDKIVIDFNRNLVMDKEKYYHLLEAVAISKTDAREMKNIIDIIYYKSCFSNLHPIFASYFGKEIAADLKKNEKILKR